MGGFLSGPAKPSAQSVVMGEASRGWTGGKLVRGAKGVW